MIEKKNHGCLVVVLVFAVIIFIGISVGVNRDLESSNDAATTQTNDTNSKNDNKLDKTKDTQKDEYTDLNKSGEIVDGVTLTVNKVTKTERIDLYNGTMYSQPDDEDGTFLVVNVTIKNKSNDAQNLNMLYFNIIGPNDEEYVPTTIVGADEEYITVDAINPNMKKTGNIAFEIPKNAKIKKYKLCYRKKGTFDSNHYFKLK